MLENQKNSFIDSKKNGKGFFFGLLFGVLVLSFFIFLPFLNSLLLAGILAVVINPLYKKFEKLFGKYRAVSSFLAIILSILIVVTPLSFIGYQIFNQSKEVYIEATTNNIPYIDNIENGIEGVVRRIIPDFELSLREYVGAVTSFASDNLGKVFSGTAQTVFFFFITIIALFHFLKDGEEFKKNIIALSPLSDKDDYKIIERLKKSIMSVMTGFIFVGFIQGAVAGIGFFIFGIPHPLLWGAITSLAALVPGVGTALITLPAVIFLFATGQIPNAIGLGVWGIMAVALVDDFIAPMLIGGRIKIHPLFVLISVLGGIVFFGPIGFLFGPIILSLLYSLVDIYKTGLSEDDLVE